MKKTMQIFAPLSLLLSWVLLGDCAPEPLKEELDMAEQSVDDMYNGCHDKAMAEMKKYFEDEKNKNPFGEAWKDAGDYLSKTKKVKEDEALTDDHLQAISLYTAGLSGTHYDNFHDIFNDAVQKGKSTYGTDKFPFHYFHFMLTSAIQILSNNQDCHITYRKTKYSFTGKEGDIIRLNYFASSSLNNDLTSFGKKTCFEIMTCSGAYLKKYAAIAHEQEVLIPPYEMFQIKTIINDKGTIKNVHKMDCERLIILKSAGVHSNLNCKVAKK